MKVKTSRIVFNIFNYALLTVLSLIFIVPYMYVLSASFSDEIAFIKTGFTLFPKVFSFGAYNYLLTTDDQMIRSIGNSLFLTIAGTFITMMVSMLYAYPLSKKYLYGNKFFSVFMIYGQNILANINKNDEGHLADRAGYFKSNGEYQRKVLTSFSNEGGYGILIRKDLMKQVQSITGLDPEDYDVTNGSYKNMTLSQFESVMKAIKDNTSVTTPVNGKPWDIGRVFGTTFGIDALSGYGFDENGNYVPAQFSVNFDKYVDLMYRWARDGIWETESNTTTDDQRLTNFVAGKCACYVAYPKAELLINVAKRFYAANTGNEEIMVIAPLASEDAKGNVLEKDGKPVVNGNLKTNRGYYGMIVPYRSKNYEILVKYLDWMYSSVDNYELCQYGVKGVDWIEGEDFVYNDTTYKTWAYPEGKESEYLSKSPYSGKYVLVPNINLSNRICSHYNTTYKTWYTSCYFEFPQFKLDNIEGIWISEPTRDIALQAADIDGDYVDTIRSYAWVGQKLDGKTPAETLAAYLIEKKSKDADFLAFTNNEYKAALEFFNAKYAQ